MMQKLIDMWFEAEQMALDFSQTKFYEVGVKVLKNWNIVNHLSVIMMIKSFNEVILNTLSIQILTKRVTFKK